MDNLRWRRQQINGNKQAWLHGVENFNVGSNYILYLNNFKFCISQEIQTRRVFVFMHVDQSIYSRL